MLITSIQVQLCEKNRQLNRGVLFKGLVAYDWGTTSTITYYGGFQW